jgi:hypothetical protein
MFASLRVHACSVVRSSSITHQGCPPGNEQAVERRRNRLSTYMRCGVFGYGSFMKVFDDDDPSDDFRAEVGQSLVLFGMTAMIVGIGLLLGFAI